ncbi:hypothetical protein [Pararhizobium sp. LjRoot238]|uniref:hypothetical protein n=1 Tax=Pararhizobium sp. LjRoot238 TaxID=3342293 RepID=UPI003ECEEB2D
MSFLSDMALNQSEIEVVCGALEEWCKETRIALDSADGRDAATVMLGLYKTGHATKGSILEAMRRVAGECV